MYTTDSFFEVAAIEAFTGRTWDEFENVNIGQVGRKKALLRYAEPSELPKPGEIYLVWTKDGEETRVPLHPNKNQGASFQEIYIKRKNEILRKLKGD